MSVLRGGDAGGGQQRGRVRCFAGAGGGLGGGSDVFGGPAALLALCGDAFQDGGLGGEVGGGLDGGAGRGAGRGER
jgi:hypothetical protein